MNQYTKTHFLSVRYTGPSRKSQPRIAFGGEWMSDLGFVPDALVQVMPEPNGLTFTLFDENIGSFSQLVKQTREGGGKFVHVHMSGGSSQRGAGISVCGKIIFDVGFVLGEPIVVRYREKCIRVRKLPTQDGVTFHQVGFISRRGKPPMPKVRVSGDWLNEIGFIQDALLTAEAKPGSVTFTLRDSDIKQYTALVKYARFNKVKLMQVRAEKNMPCFALHGSGLTKAGLAIDDVYAMSHEHGVIRITKLDFDSLGF